MFLFRDLFAQGIFNELSEEREGRKGEGRDGRYRLEGRVEIEMERRRRMRIVGIFCIYLCKDMPFQGIRLVLFFFVEEGSWPAREGGGRGGV